MKKQLLLLGTVVSISCSCLGMDDDPLNPKLSPRSFSPEQTYVPAAKRLKQSNMHNKRKTTVQKQSATFCTNFSESISESSGVDLSDSSQGLQSSVQPANMFSEKESPQSSHKSGTPINQLSFGRRGLDSPVRTPNSTPLSTPGSSYSLRHESFNRTPRFISDSSLKLSSSSSAALPPKELQPSTKKSDSKALSMINEDTDTLTKSSDTPQLPTQQKLSPELINSLEKERIQLKLGILNSNSSDYGDSDEEQSPIMSDSQMSPETKVPSMKISDVLQTPSTVMRSSSPVEDSRPSLPIEPGLELLRAWETQIERDKEEERQIREENKRREREKSEKRRRMIKEKQLKTQPRKKPAKASMTDEIGPLSCHPPVPGSLSSGNFKPSVKRKSSCSKLSSPAYGYQNSVGSKGNQSILQFPSVVLPPQSVYIIDEEIPCVAATSLEKQKSVSSDPWSRDDFEDFHMPGVNETRDPGMQNSIDDKEDWFVAYCSKLEG